jgi:hypothetical protein
MAMAQAPAPPQPQLTTVESDSRQARDELRSLLRRYPPQVASVIRLDPTLLGNQTYMANYPALAAFMAQHPVVSHNPEFFLDGVGSLPEAADPSGYRMWRDILSDIGGFSVFLIFVLVLVWAIKTLIEQRRWSRLSAIQTEVHSKLLDRFTSNEELLAYLQTTAGKRFLESAPLPVEAGPRPMSAPFGRILWSVQAGFVMVAVGIGFDLVSLRVAAASAAPLYGIGVVALLVGIALLLSAGVFYVLSRKFGLLQANVS